MIEYDRFTELSGFYLEDSFVLDITETATELTFTLDAVLTPEHPAYHPPRAGEHHCYRSAQLRFFDIHEVEWIRRSSTVCVDAAGEQDRGNIDVLQVEASSVVVEGDWGHVRLSAGSDGTLPRFRIQLCQ